MFSEYLSNPLAVLAKTEICHDTTLYLHNSDTTTGMCAVLGKLHTVYCQKKQNLRFFERIGGLSLLENIIELSCPGSGGFQGLQV